VTSMGLFHSFHDLLCLPLPSLFSQDHGHLSLACHSSHTPSPSPNRPYAS
jgi:hypothetical protein